LQDSESAGIRGARAEVLIISADVANHAQMQAAIAQSLKRFGKVSSTLPELRVLA